jgi:hypothetical protein
MSKEETRQRLLEELAKSHQSPVVLEIGVWKGDFSQHLLDVLNPNRLVLVDPWKMRSDYQGAWYGPEVTNEEMESIYLGVVSRFKKDDRVSVVRTESTNLSQVWSPGEFDFIYIDGDHTAEGFSSDLSLATSLCRPGGYIVCDDYSLPGWWDDAITKIVDSNTDFRLTHVGPRGTQYVFQRTNIHYS